MIKAFLRGVLRGVILAATISALLTIFNEGGLFP